MHLLQSATESHKKLVYREEKKEAQRSSKEWWKWYWCLCNSRSSPFLRPVAFQPLVWVFLFLFLKALFSGLNALKLDSVTCKERVLTQTAHLQAKVKGRGQCIALPANCDQHETPWINYCFSLPPWMCHLKPISKEPRVWENQKRKIWKPNTLANLSVN